MSKSELRRLAVQVPKIGALRRDYNRLLDALTELLNAGDNSVSPADGDDIAAMLRYGKANETAKQLIAALPRLGHNQKDVP